MHPDINKESIRKVQAVLLKIDLKQPVFFNIAVYKELGLVYSRDQWGKDSSGNKARIKTEFYLTTKGKRILNTVL